MAKNVYSLQLLRNGTPYTSYTEAVNGIQAAATQDGVLKLARYTQAGSDPYSGDTGGHIKTIFAFRHEVGGESGYTIYEDYKEVVDVIKAKIDSMTGEGSGSIYGQIMTELRKLDYTGVTTGDGVVVTNVTETDGVVSATSANVGSLKLTGYEQVSDTDDVAATDTINQAFAKLQNQIDELSGSTDDAIEALDAVITAADGSYIDKVEQVDGKISGTTKELPTVAEISEAGKPIVAVSETKGAVSAATGTINAEFVNVADADNNFTASTVEAVLAEIKSGYTAADAALKDEILGGASANADTLGELETLINNVSNAAKSYSITAVTGSELTNLGANVNEAYKLVDEDGTKAGDYIKIYKDQTLKSAEYSGQSLVLTYILADGSESAVSIDMHDLIEQTEFASGVTWDATASKVRGVVDSTSETFLTVGADGFKLAGVQAAIDAASGDVKSKLDELSGKTEALSAKTVTGIDMTGGTAAITANTDGTKKITIDTDGSKILATGYAKGTDASAIAATDSINAALAKLENQVDAAKAAATTKVEKDANASHITLSSSTADDGSVTYTIGEDDIASASDLTDEIDAIETAVGLNNNGTYNANTSNTYTNNATSVADAVDKLDAAVKDNADDIVELSGKTITGITMNGTGVTVTNNVAAMTASYTNTAANSTDGMVITTGADGGLTFQFGTLDCGNYD